MHEIHRRVLISLPPVLGMDLSITNEVVLLWVAALVTFAVLAGACRRKNVVPRGWLQNSFEALIDFLQQEVVREGIGSGGQVWSPFLLTLFFFILFANLLGLVPLPHHVKAATANINVTGGLALTVFVLTFLIGLRRNGVGGFLRKFVPAGLPWWVAVMLVPVEIVSWLVRPVSLAVRLFANMMAGHALVFIFIGLEMTGMWLLKPLPLAGAVAMSCFEVFVCLIQAFVFTMLAGVYIRDALEPAGSEP